MSDSPLIDVPTGRKLDEGDKPEGWFANVRGLPDASKERIAFASRHFKRVSDDEYESDGRHFVEKSTGERYVMAIGDPLLAENPSDLGIVAFIVREDDRMIFLKTPGYTSASKSVVLGSVGALR